MSRRSWTTTDGRLVTCGWDNPLATFWMDVYSQPKVLPDLIAGVRIFSEPELLYESPMGERYVSLTEIFELLRQQAIDPPLTLMHDLRLDYYDYNSSGTIVQYSTPVSTVPPAPETDTRESTGVELFPPDAPYSM